MWVLQSSWVLHRPVRGSRRLSIWPTVSQLISSRVFTGTQICPTPKSGQFPLCSFAYRNSWRRQCLCPKEWLFEGGIVAYLPGGRITSDQGDHGQLLHHASACQWSCSPGPGTTGREAWENPVNGASLHASAAVLNCAGQSHALGCGLQ